MRSSTLHRGAPIVLAALMSIAPWSVARALETPKLLLDPDHGPAGSSFHVTYAWPGCGGLPTGSYTLELYWDTDSDLLPPSGSLIHGGSGDCVVELDTEVPAGAPSGSHDVIAKLFDGTKSFVGFSDVKGEFTVEDKPKPTATPGSKPTAGPTKGAGPTSGPRKSDEPSATPADPEPTADLEPEATPEPEKSPDLGTASDPPSTMDPPFPPVHGPLPSTGPDGEPIVPVAGLAETDESFVEMLGRVATGAGHVATDLLLGGMTDLGIAVSKGQNPFAGDSGPNLSRSLGEGVNPDVAATASDVYAVWADSHDGNWEVMLARSDDHGYTFGRAVNLTDNPSASQHPKVVADGARVTVAWDDDAAGLTSVYSRTSTDRGATWGPPVLVGLGQEPVLATGGGSDYVAFAGGLLRRDIYAARIGGATVQVTSNGDLHRAPVIAASGSNVSIAWETLFDPVWDTGYAVSWDRGATWRTNFIPPGSTYPGPRDGRLRACFHENADVTHPALAVSGTTVLVSSEWWQYADVMQASDDGRGWTTGGYCNSTALLAARSDPLAGHPLRISAAAAGPWACVAIRTASGDGAGAPTRTGLALGCWRGGTRPTATALRSRNDDGIDRPVVRLLGDRPLLAWQERTAGGAFDVWFQAIGGTAQNLSSTSGDSTAPHMATSGDNVTVLWTEDSNGNRQVHFRTSPAR